MTRISIALAAVLALAACSTQPADNSDEMLAGAAIGGALGAGVANNGNRAEGAILGAAAGAAIGAAAGSQTTRTCLYRNTVTGETWRAACPT